MCASFGRLTLKEKEAKIKQLLKENDEELCKALLVVYNNQTSDEKCSGSSIDYNDVGFNRNDSKELTVLAERVRNGQKLTLHELSIVRHRLPKYWRQILNSHTKEEKPVSTLPIKVTIIRHPQEEDWKRCKLFALNTIGKQYGGSRITLDWKKKILRARHSPIRTLMFSIQIELPYNVSVHYVRHKVGVEHYVQSQRNDRQSKYDRDKAPQNTPVSHILDINAEALITMMNKRLCNQADATTRYCARLICEEVLKVNPEFREVLVPPCYFMKSCPEFNPCGVSFAEAHNKPEQLSLALAT